VNASDAACQRRRGHSTARGPDDLGITESEPDHFERGDSRVHACDHQNPSMRHPVEAVQIKVLCELFVVGK
jgi:hypothetical protein